MYREELIDYALGHVCDLVPYDDPEYTKKVMELAESYADLMLDPEKLNKAFLEMENTEFDFGHNVNHKNLE